jgi:hypothetical protein
MDCPARIALLYMFGIVITAGIALIRALRGTRG